MTECLWLPCPECAATCPDYNCDREPDDGCFHEENCSHYSQSGENRSEL